jgi:hypothetical protein
MGGGKMTPISSSRHSDVVRRVAGRKAKITREEMGAILVGLADVGLDLHNPYVPRTMGDAFAASLAWVEACRGITCISVSLCSYLRDGQVRYDQPGRMHPTQHAEITFAPEGLLASTYYYLRQHADRVLVVRQDRKHSALIEREKIAAAKAEVARFTTCGCDNGHKWRTDDPQRDLKCPTCGEYWV